MHKRGRPVTRSLSAEPPQAQLNSYNYCQTGTEGGDRKRHLLLLDTHVPQHDRGRGGRGEGGGGKKLKGSS